MSFSRLLPVVLLVVCLAATLGGWQLAREHVEDQVTSDLRTESVRLETELTNRMAAYAQVLYGASALMAASDNVTREEWRIYYTSLDLDRRFPGAQAIAYSEFLRGADALAAHEARVQAEGFPSYKVTPEGERDVYTAIVYIEPFDERNQRAFGYDMLSHPVRREAMERARDTGEPALSGRVELVQENGTDVQPGFLLYVPVYARNAPVETVGERREALQGWVYAPFRARDFVTALDVPGENEIHLRIFDGPRTDDELLFDSQSTPPRGPRYETRLMLAGHTWTLVERPGTDATPPVLELLPLSALLAGLTLSALVFGISWALTKTRERALRIAADMTVELRRRTRELEHSNQALRQFSYVVTHDLKEPVRGIDVYLAVLAEDHDHVLNGEARTLVSGARAASARLTRLLAGLLELSNVDRAQLATAPLDAREVLDSEACRASYETLARERGARIEVGDAPRVLASASVLAQALGNLVGNAIRHNPRQRPRVLVHGVHDASRPGKVEIIVEDDGPGFPPEIIEGFAAGRTDTRGFGLLLARQSIERLGGHMDIGRSRALGGGAVRLSLPGAPAPPAERGTDRATRPRTRGSSSASR